MPKFGSAAANMRATRVDALAKQIAKQWEDAIVAAQKAADAAPPAPNAPFKGYKQLQNDSLTAEQQLGLTHAIGTGQVVDAGNYYVDIDGNPIATKQLQSLAQSWVEMFGSVGEPLVEYAPDVAPPVTGPDAYYGYDSLSDYLTRIQQVANDPTSLTDTTQPTRNIEDAFREQLDRGEVSQDYLDYLRFHGVDQRTIDAVRSGELPMDESSRGQRARDMGLDPDAVWWRIDRPLKNEFKGYTGAALTPSQHRRSKSGTLGFIDLTPSREGLVYTSHSPELAQIGAQMPENVRHAYPLLGPSDGIAGLDALPPESYEKFSASLQAAMLKKVREPADRRRMVRSMHLAEPLAYGANPEDLRRQALAKLRTVEPDTVTGKLADRTIPLYGVAENRKLYTEPLMASGAKGTLVRDETGLSTAFTPSGARMLRHADLAPLDPKFAGSRNILQSLALPIASGGLLGGLRDSREQSR